MLPLFSTAQIRSIDYYAINELGIPGIVLMENAALQIFRISSEETSGLRNREKVGFVCGKGNNGGDGFAVARQFANHGYSVCVIYTGNEEEFSPDCKTNYSALLKISKENENILIKKYTSIKDLRHLTDCGIIFDALLGSGAKGELREPYLTIVKNINKINAFKIAVDIPTGLDPDTGYAITSFSADLTITLGELKNGLFIGDGYKYCGKVKKGNIGIAFSYFDKFETEEYLIEPEDALEALPAKMKNAHKYSAGKVLTIAGSADLPGAAVISGNSTLKSGAGASILCFPESAKNELGSKIPELIVKLYKDCGNGFLIEDNIEELAERIEWADVISVGPGLGRNAETQHAVRKLLTKFPNKKMVIDADAIYALKDENYRAVDLSGKVLTPHHGEFSSLIGISVDKLKRDIISYGKSFVNTTGSYLVLKGTPTIIFTPNGDALINTVGNPGMAKFGTGDALTGIIAGMMAQHEDTEKPVIAGVYLHSLSADLLLKNLTEYSITATDIMNNLSSAINFIRGSIV